MTGKLEFFPMGAWTFKKRQSSWPDTVWYSRCHLWEWWYSFMRINCCSHCYIYHVIPRSVVGFYQSGFLLPGDGSHYDGLLGALDSIVWKSIIIFTISSLSGREFHWNATVCPPEVDFPEICMHGLGIWLAIRGVVQESLYASSSNRFICRFQKLIWSRAVSWYLMVSHLHVLWKILNMLQF